MLFFSSRSSITWEMQSEFKKIILLKGLEPINEYQFSMVKFLLASDLKLTRKAQNEYNRIQIADLMTENFPRATCVDKLIELYKDIAELKQLAKTLKNEKLKGNDLELLTLTLSEPSSTLIRKP